MAGFLSGLLLPPSVEPAAASPTLKCQELSTLFFEEYQPGERWGRPGQPTTITWSTSAPVIQGRAPFGDEPVLRPFSAEEELWIARAVNAWDEALSTVTFLRVDRPTANVTIGLVQMRDRSFPGWWSGWTNGERRTKATIMLRLASTVDGRELSDEAGFIHVVLHEVGNVLGLGDIAWDTLRERSPGATSVMLDPRRPPLAQTPLSDFDRDLIQQVYGENACPAGSPMAPPSAAASGPASANPGQPRTCARYPTGRPDCTATTSWVYDYCHAVAAYRIEIQQGGRWSTARQDTAPRSQSCGRGSPFRVRFSVPVVVGESRFRLVFPPQGGVGGEVWRVVVTRS